MKYLIATFLFLVTATAFAQQVDLRGQVLDSEFNNEPLAFANVKVKGLDLEAVSDENGFYELALTPGSYTLEVEFIGYESQMITDVMVDALDLQLDPVVLGARRMKKDLSVALTDQGVEPSNE